MQFKGKDTNYKTTGKYIGFKLLFDLLLALFFGFLIRYHEPCVYLLYQAKGQLDIVLNTKNLEEFEQGRNLNESQKANLHLITQIKRYAVDSLGFVATENYNRIYDQGGKPVLWTITASEPYAFVPYQWTFPIVGRVSYKGFFVKEKAQKEEALLLEKGYDVELREVSAWSTLGWFHDPVLSSMLNRTKGSLCNLIFHELFHATCYRSDELNTNENLADFVAHKATLQFLKQDSSALATYSQNYSDADCYNKYMFRKMNFLSAYYKEIRNLPDREALKMGTMNEIFDSISFLPLYHKKRYLSRKTEFLKHKNAAFVSLVQYNSLQDSLEQVFNKIYRGKIEKMVQDLKPI